MKKTFFIISLFLFIAFVVFGQKNYKPTVVVLDPYQTSFDSNLLKEIQAYTSDVGIPATEERYILDSLNKKAPNIRTMDVAEFYYRKQMNFASKFTLTLYGMLSYKIFGQVENCVVIPSHATVDGSIKDLQITAQKHKVVWVVSPMLLHTYTKDGQKFTMARIQVYDYKKNKIIFDKTYEGDTKNPGFELSCESGSLDCTINNIVRLSLPDILQAILK